LTGTAPERGSVIRYCYLWADEDAPGQEAGRKDRPALVLALSVMEADGTTDILVLAVTHTPPANAADKGDGERSSAAWVESGHCDRAAPSTASRGMAVILGLSRRVRDQSFVQLCRGQYFQFIYRLLYHSPARQKPSGVNADVALPAVQKCAKEPVRATDKRMLKRSLGQPIGLCQ
jgi:hypothetical protein